MERFNKKLNKKIFILNVSAFGFIVVCLLIIFPLMFSKIPSPYSATENIYWVFKNLSGFSSWNQGLVENISPVTVVSSEVEPQKEIVFAGDLLPMNGQKLLFTPEIKRYISKNDFFVGSLEGMITEKKSAPSLWNFDMERTRDELNLFRKIVNPQKILLSVANNHAFDYGKEEFDKSNRLLRYAGLNVFGTHEKPFHDMDSSIRIIGATQWSNKKNEGVVTLQEAEQYIKKDAYNILYLHFGYEFELYPREETVEQTQQLLEKFDAVIGHNPYCPQPVTLVSVGGEKKLAAYSLGTFFSEAVTPHYRYGLLLKLFLGSDIEGRVQLSRVEYKTIKCNPLMNGDYLVDMSQELIGDFNKINLIGEKEK